jgi:hypothetical protein
MHPLAIPGNRSAAFEMKAGDRVVSLDGRRGVADEFLPDGDALVTFDGGTFGELWWNTLDARYRMKVAVCGSPRCGVPLSAQNENTQPKTP